MYDPSLWNQIIFAYECFFLVLWLANTQEHRTWGTETESKLNKMNYSAKKQKFWCAVHANGVIGLQYFNNEPVKGASPYQMLTFKSDQKLNNPLSPTECYFSGAWSLFSPCLRCLLSKIVASKIRSNRVASRITRNSPTGLYYLGTRAGPNILDFCV